MKKTDSRSSNQESEKYECLKNPAEKSMVIVKANPKQGGATTESNFSYLMSP